MNAARTNKPNSAADAAPADIPQWSRPAAAFPVRLLLSIWQGDLPSNDCALTAHCVRRFCAERV